MSIKSCVICNKIYMATEHLNHHMVVAHGLGESKVRVCACVYVCVCVSSESSKASGQVFVR